MAQRDANVVLSTLKADQNSHIICTYSDQTLDDILRHDGLLAAISFDSPCKPSTNPRHYHCGLTPLQNKQIVEAWYSSLPVTYGTEGGCHWSQTDELMFAGLVVDEAGFPSQTHAIRSAYLELIRLISTKGYPHIIRSWNYMADINRGEGDEERYKLFCAGRQQAFEDARYGSNQYPSACALGHRHGQTIIYLIAARQPGTHFENPLQRRAYLYPRKFGPKSPSFSRATLVEWQKERQLYVSGTASIIGYETRHPKDLGKQLDTTLENIDSLLTHVGRQTGLSKTPTMSIAKVYLRHAEDLSAVQPVVQQHFGEGVPILFVQADVCRSELLVEIDGLCEI